MTRPAVYKQAVLGLRKRHVSETVVMDRIGRRRNRAQAAIRDTRIPPVRLINYLLAAAFLEVMVILWALSELGVIS